MPKGGDFSEPLNTAEKRIEQSDALAQVPAVAMAWKVPERGSRDQAPMAVLAELLAGGDASMLYQGLVKGRELALNVDVLFGLTSPWEYGGPTLLTIYAMYKPTTSADAILAAMDEEIAKIVKDGVDAATLKRVKTRMLADWNNGLESFINRADTVAKIADHLGRRQRRQQDPRLDRRRDLERHPARGVAPIWCKTNRTVIDRKPVAKAAGRHMRLPASKIRSASMKKLMLTLAVSLAFAPAAFAATHRPKPAPCRPMAPTSRSRRRRSSRRRSPTA